MTYLTSTHLIYTAQLEQMVEKNSWPNQSPIQLKATAIITKRQQQTHHFKMVLLNDHINLQGVNPLTGPAWATRFPDMSFTYNPTMRDLLRRGAKELGLELAEGVYAAMHGPSYETPAEIRMAKVLGADVVGMSTVPEAIAAAEVGLPVAAISVVSNFAAGLTSEALSHDDVTALSGELSRKVAELLALIAKRYPAP